MSSAEWGTFRIFVLSFAKPVGDAAPSQVRIMKADNFGSWPQSVTTQDALLCTLTTCALRFWNYRPRFMVILNLDEVLWRKSALRVFKIGAVFS
jgi:hypothetical protein